MREFTCGKDRFGQNGAAGASVRTGKEQKRAPARKEKQTKTQNRPLSTFDYEKEGILFLPSKEPARPHRSCEGKRREGRSTWRPRRKERGRPAPPGTLKNAWPTCALCLVFVFPERGESREPSQRTENRTQNEKSRRNKWKNERIKSTSSAGRARRHWPCTGPIRLLSNRF